MKLHFRSLYRPFVPVCFALICTGSALSTPTTVAGQTAVVHKRRPILARCFGSGAARGESRILPNVPFNAWYETLPLWHDPNADCPAGADCLTHSHSAPDAFHQPLPQQPDGEQHLSVLSGALNPTHHDQTFESLGSKIQFSIIPTLAEANPSQRDAEHAFRQGRYDEAAMLVKHAIEIDPHNGMLYLFSSQAHFADGKFRSAATELDSATNMLAPSHWSFFGENFAAFYGENDYVHQTRLLNEYTSRRPDDYQAKVLLGYHLGSAGHRSAATQLFHQALRTNPTDLLAQRLLPELGAPTLPVSTGAFIEAPTPEKIGFHNGTQRTPAWATYSSRPKRIYLTSQFVDVPTQRHLVMPLIPSSIDSHDSIDPPMLEGPATSHAPHESLDSVLEQLPAPLDQ